MRSTQQPTIPARCLRCARSIPRTLPGYTKCHGTRPFRHLRAGAGAVPARHAAYFVQQVAIAGWDSGQRAEFLAADTASGPRLGRVGVGLRGAGAAEIGYWVDPAARRRGVATHPVRAPCAGGRSHHWSWRSSNGELRVREPRLPPSRGEGRIPRRGDSAQAPDSPRRASGRLGWLLVQGRLTSATPGRIPTR